MHYQHHMPFGTSLRPEGCDFALWAPSAKRVQLWIEGVAHDCAAVDRGWWRLRLNVPAGSRYEWILDVDSRVP